MAHLEPHFFASLNARLAALQAEGRDIIRLDEGSPDLPPAPHIIEALSRAARRPDTHSYQPHRGTAALRQAWGGMYQRLYGVELDAETEILPLLGSKEGIFHLGLAYLEAGDVVLAPDPGYITYTRGAQAAGAEVHTFPLQGGCGYLPDLSAIPENLLRRAKLMWLNYPNNPTAAVADRGLFAQAVALAQEYGFLVCHDAAYTQIAFDGERPPSLLETPGAGQVAVEFNTLSKSHNMAGWRTGALVGNSQAVRALYTLKTNADSGHFLPILEATTAALTGDQGWLVERNEIYRQRRDVVVAGLRQMGLPVSVPRASLYIWSPVPGGWNSVDFTIAALEQASVSVTPGTVFGAGGEGFVRISITAEVERIRQAMERLGEWITEEGMRQEGADGIRPSEEVAG
jgi:LL-diaminopimelate aminotransferase